MNLPVSWVQKHSNLI